MRTCLARTAMWVLLCALTLVGVSAAGQLENVEKPDQPAKAAEKPDQEEDLYALELINSDLANANSTLNQFDLNNNRRLEAAESRRLARLGWPTEKFDLNKDGSLTMLEIAVRFAAQRKEFHITLRDEQVANAILGRYDLNKDRFVDADETRKGAWPDDPERWDLDKDGRLTHFEIASMQSVKRRERDELGITGIDVMVASRMIQLNDRNSDRRLNAEEFRAAVKIDIPKSFDTNGDGVLSLEEISAGFARKRQQDGVTFEDQQQARALANRYDINHDFTVDQNERTLWTEDHTQFDLDKNGEIDLAEIAAVYARERAKDGVTNADQVAARSVLARYDRNRNGSIDLDEANDRPGGKEEAGDARISVTTETFIDFDANADGRLGVRELARYVASQRKK